MREADDLKDVKHVSHPEGSKEHGNFNWVSVSESKDDFPENKDEDLSNDGKNPLQQSPSKLPSEEVTYQHQNPEKVGELEVKVGFEALPESFGGNIVACPLVNEESVDGSDESQNVHYYSKEPQVFCYKKHHVGSNCNDEVVEERDGWRDEEGSFHCKTEQEHHTKKVGVKSPRNGRNDESEGPVR